MTAELLLGIRLTPFEKMSVVKLSDVNLKEKVEKLRAKTAGQTNLPQNSFDLIYSGCLLENDYTLESYDLKSGSMVHVLKKKEEKDTAASSSAGTSSSERNIDNIISTIETYTGTPLFPISMNWLTRHTDMEKLISLYPEIGKDPVAVAFIQDPDLFAYLTQPKTLRRIAKLHPCILDVAQHIASHLELDLATISAPRHNLRQRVPPVEFLENLSDDEEMVGDSSQSSDSTQPSNSANNSRNQSTPATRSLRSTGASNATDNASSATSPVSSNSQTNSNSGGVITYEMFNQAMQLAFAHNPAANNLGNSIQLSPSSVPFTAPQDSSPANDMQRQIAIMHEMGLENDAVNIEALHITNGEVQAAIELVLSGFGDN